MMVYVLRYGVYHSDLYEMVDDVHGIVLGVFSTYEKAVERLKELRHKQKEILESFIDDGCRIDTEEDNHGLILYNGDDIDTEYQWSIDNCIIDE